MAKAVDVVFLGDKNLERKLKQLGTVSQRRVLSKSMDVTAKTVIKPILKSKLPTRSVEPPEWRPELGKGVPQKSHTGRPGSLKNKLKVKSGKRSRVSISRLVMMPTRKRLGIPDNYPFYYPAAIEYGVKFNRFMGRQQAPKKYFRTVYQQHRGPIVGKLRSEARRQMVAEAARLRKMK
jgi:hypothetical protein